MIIITTVSVSENILDLNKGIFFYAFFFSLLLAKDKAGDKKDISTTDKTGNPDNSSSV